MLVATAIPRKDIKDERLPVVELKPFLSSTNKEWIPAKSRTFDENEFVNPHIQLTGRSDFIYYNNNEFPDPQKLDTPRQVEAICSKAYPVAGERKSCHPKMKDVAEGTVIQREASFVPKYEREKTTNEDIKQQQLQQAIVYSQYQPFSFITRELTDCDIQRQNLMRIHGQKMKKLPPNVNTMYMETWQIYKTVSNKPGRTVTNKQQLIESLQAKSELTENTYLDESIYDQFDRSVTLPSIMVKPANCKTRPNTKSQKGFNSKRPGYRLGVVNSLDVMSMCGKPLTIEQNLTTHLKHSLEHMKRTRDSSFILNNNERPSSNKIEVIGRPTIGEIKIQEGRKNNSSSFGSQSAPAKRSKSYNMTQSRATTYYCDSVFDDISQGRKTSSPSKSLQRNSKTPILQANKAISRTSSKNPLHSSSVTHLEDPPSSPTEGNQLIAKQQSEDICSVDSGELEMKYGSKSGKSTRGLNSGKTVAFDDELVQEMQDNCKERKHERAEVNKMEESNTVSKQEPSDTDLCENSIISNESNKVQIDQTNARFPGVEKSDT